MKPNSTIIYFNVISGFGYGIIIMLFVLIFFSNIDLNLNTKVIISILSLFFVSSGLLFSILQLERPKRMLKVVSQWKTSWSSREGIFAILTFIYIVVFFSIWIFFNNLILEWVFFTSPNCNGKFIIFAFLFNNFSIILRKTTK